MRVAVLGFGTVGRGVVDIIDRCVESLEVTKIVDLPQNCSGLRMTPSFDEVIQDDSIEAVVECMGGIEPAHSFIVQALEAGKHVVTSNKAVVAQYFEEFVAAAKASGAGLAIEASVGGGIPWIASIAKLRRIDEVSSFYGILNGTTNYIIDQMNKHGADFDEVLAQAQELGYAERDPSADIDGIDVYNKALITASVAFDVACTRDIPVSGIRNLTKADLEYFEARGQSIKLLAKGVCKDGRYAVAVEPTVLDLRSVEANIPDNFNIATIEGATVGPLKFYGQGAGSLPTGNAMVQDLLDLSEGQRPHYDFSRGPEWDPTLLTSDYILRTGSATPAAAAAHYEVLHQLTPVEARARLDEALKTDPKAFLAALDQEAH
ncbi:MAG: homoserine dehydrogenase [Atopobiaceae bacterium]|nr:homoserine dehydrogenase [Atopobiaceae bacterium]